MTCCLSCIDQSTVGIVERVGEFQTVYPPGLNFINPCTQEVAGTVSLRLRLMNVDVHSVSAEKTSVVAHVSVMYRAIPSMVHVAFYSLQNPTGQIHSYVENSLRGHLPHHEMAALFLMKSEIADLARRDLDKQLPQYGFEIVELLVKDILPAREIIGAMTNQVVQRYDRISNLDRTEIERMSQIKAAEAQAEVSRLSGVGAGEMQKAASLGMKELMGKFNGGEKTSEVMAQILVQQYMDALIDIEKAANDHVVFTADQGMLRHRVGAA